jgi:phosphohistidine phosphatase
VREVLLVRHGKAAPAAPGGDPQRPLTDEGQADIAVVGKGLRALGLIPDVIWHSPYVRAVETAQILAKALDVANLKAEGILTPNGNGERAAQHIRDAEPRRLMCVSHMPLLPSICLELVGARLDFGTGTVAHIGIVGPHATTLLGLWTAEQLAHVR